MGSTLSSSQEHDWSKGYQPSESAVNKNGLRSSTRPATSSGTLTGAGSGGHLEKPKWPLMRINSTPVFSGNFGLKLSVAGGGKDEKDGLTLSRAKKRGDFRKLVESKKIVIGEPILESFQHLSHMGADEVGTTKPRPDLRKSVNAGKIVIGGPVEGSFQHTRHLGIEDVTIH
ncbi:hypothetical protein BCR33DRAFT_714327 [Rhizoclosmatium globosum]|uniref:CRIB domain-containing protein n=1 Tax=Rhizoclosmatium globosum TaxID=329046 RepID=A0A1Y2CNL1_9FUNG|nr:hypothetical protein BCR33DRAFT_714327 [Rhizoclosmatium globosum]|eukprot:ORY48567.1 hypothetical protein BCR33DRAFT_714327 [Rhizoclosmatium globosum]